MADWQAWKAARQDVFKKRQAMTLTMTVSLSAFDVAVLWQCCLIHNLNTPEEALQFMFDYTSTLTDWENEGFPTINDY